MKITLTPKQSLVLTSDARHVFLGGAAGGGKSVSIKTTAIHYCLSIPNLTFFIFRNSAPQLRSNYMEGGYSFPILLEECIKNGSVRINYNELTIKFMHNNSQIRMRHMSHVNDANDILGVEISAAAIDEASQMQPELIRFIINRTRIGSMKEHIPEHMAHKFPFLLLASNPGGPSADMLKRWFVDAAPWGTEFESAVEFGQAKSLFIPARLADNPHMEDTYRNSIMALADPIKIRQMLEGDWEAMSSTLMGYAFNRGKNICKTVPPEDFDKFTIIRAFDYGFSSPAACAWIGTLKDGKEFEMTFGDKKFFPRGTKVLIREWQVCKEDDHSQGLRLTERELSEHILMKEERWGLLGKVKVGPGDVFDRKTGEFSIGDEMAKYGVRFTMPWKSKNSRSIGWSRMCGLMLEAHKDVVEKPALLFGEDCIHAIRTIPALPPDPSNPDDCISVGVDDHMPDAVRYGISQKENKMTVVQVTGL